MRSCVPTSGRFSAVKSRFMMTVSHRRADMGSSPNVELRVWGQDTGVPEQKQKHLPIQAFASPAPVEIIAQSQCTSGFNSAAVFQSIPYLLFRIACSIKGNVKKNTSPSTGSGEELLDFQPLSTMKERLVLGCPVANV